MPHSFYYYFHVLPAARVDAGSDVGNSARSMIVSGLPPSDKQTTQVVPPPSTAAIRMIMPVKRVKDEDFLLQKISRSNARIEVTY